MSELHIAHHGPPESPAVMPTRRPSSTSPRLTTPLLAPLALALAFMLAGCPRSSPATVPSPTPPTRTASVEAELRALAEARAHFDAGRFHTAARLLRHFLELHAHTSNAIEARWILGRSYEELGEWHAALAQYRIIVAEAARPPGLPPALNTQVRDRISVLTRVLGRASSATSGFVAIALDPAHLPDPGRWEQWLTPLLAEGITTLIVDVAPVSRPTSSGVYFRTTWARLERDLFTELIPLAHDLGLTVFASLDLTQMPWLDPTLGWTTYVLDEGTRRLTPTRSFDLLHPSVQEYLTGFLSDLARTQVDGLIALFGSRNGPRYHVSRKGLEQFAQSLGVEIDPVQLLSYAHTVRVHDQRVTPATPASDPMAEYFWRWTGWQSREHLNVLDRLRAAMRRQHTGIHVAIAFHDVSLTNSPIGLLEHGEDLLEAANRGFGVALPLAALSPQASAGPGAPSGSAFADQVTRTLDYVGSAERLWLLEPVSHLDRASLSRLLSAPQVHILRSRGINLVITAPTP